MKICVSGFTASGKSSLSELLSKRLDYNLVTSSYKPLVKDYLNMASFVINANPEFIKSFDNDIISRSTDNSVISSWASPWLIKDADLRVWLFSDINKRAERRIKQMKLNISNEVMVNFIKNVDESNISVFKKMYNIDMDDTSIFDICINTGKIDIEKSVELILSLIR